MTRPNNKNNRHSKMAEPEMPFICEHCHRVVPVSESGTRHRNHCPSCLWSKHVDLVSGDRRAMCKGKMEPIAVSIRTSDEWVIVHQCRQCGFIRTNRIAGDDNEYILLAIAIKPLANPPFPLAGLAEGPMTAATIYKEEQL